MPNQLKINFGGINERNIETLRKLNEHIFPVHYSENFYTEVIKARHQEYKLFAFCQGIIVGTCCVWVLLALIRAGWPRSRSLHALNGVA